jgi:hypothetical protein
LVCLPCDKEALACPEKYRPTHMHVPLERTRKLGSVTLLPQYRRDTSFYSIGRGRHAQPVLRAVEVEV